MNPKKITMVIILLFLAGCTQPAEPVAERPLLEPSSNLYQEKNGWMGAVLHDHELFNQYAETHGFTLEQTKKFFKETYGIEREEEIYAQLPVPPATVLADANTLYRGNAEELFKIEENVYRQPEFYPTFETIGIKTWIDAPGRLARTIGIASLPAEQEARIRRNREIVETALFISAGWGVTEYQAFGLRAEVKPAAPLRVSIEPKDILLGPAFPRFDAEWAQKIRILVEWDENIAAGTYQISIYADNPSPELEKRAEADKNKTYVNANSGIGPADGLATLTIEIEPRENE